MAIPVAYGIFPCQGSNRNCSRWPMPEPHKLRIWAMSATYTTAHGNARSLTNWVRPGIKSVTPWFLVRFVSAVPCEELPGPNLLCVPKFICWKSNLQCDDIWRQGLWKEIRSWVKSSSDRISVLIWRDERACFFSLFWPCEFTMRRLSIC